MMPVGVRAQQNVRIYPNTDTVCFNTPLTLHIPGQSFVPSSFLWSNGSTSNSINATNSGTYTLTVTGTLGQSSQIRTVTISKNYVVSPKPTIQFVTGPWVCKLDTVKMTAQAGYQSYVWKNGYSGISCERQMTGSGTGANLDTTSFWYTAKINGVCEVNSDTVVLRGIRKPEGIGYFYCGKTDVTKDSIPTGLVLTYIYAPQYEIEITQLSDTANQFTHLTAPGVRKFPSNLLIPGEIYSVRSRAIINGIPYCWGNSCTVGLVPNSNRAIAFIGQDPYPTSWEVVDLPSLYEIYSMDGRMVSSTKAEKFDQSVWNSLNSGYYIVRAISSTSDKRFLFLKGGF